MSLQVILCQEVAAVKAALIEEGQKGEICLNLVDYGKILLLRHFGMCCCMHVYVHVSVSVRFEFGIDTIQIVWIEMFDNHLFWFIHVYYSFESLMNHLEKEFSIETLSFIMEVSNLCPL